MKLSWKKAIPAIGLITAAGLALSGCAGSGSNSGSTEGGKTLVVDASFDLKTADPNRQYETTGQIVAKALYQTLLTFDGDDVTQPIDGLASYEMNEDNTVMTLTMKEARASLHPAQRRACGREPRGRRSQRWHHRCERRRRGLPER